MSEAPRTEEEPVKYACKRCRTVLFDSTQIEPHAPPPSHVCTFKYRRSFGVAAQAEPEKRCTSMFLQPCQEWMGDITAQDGRLLCPKCQAVVGKWKWGGLQCSCSVWHTPAFQVPYSRVDEIRPRPKAEQPTPAETTPEPTQP